MGTTSLKDDARFFKFVEISSPAGCWIWRGTRQIRGGYGHFWGKSRHVLAHRYAYEALREPIPEGLVCDHLCRTPECVNPYHLELVTQTENMRRGLSTGYRKTHCPAGHAYDEKNTYYNPRGFRACRACGRKHTKAYIARKRAAA